MMVHVNSRQSRTLPLLALLLIAGLSPALALGLSAWVEAFRGRGPSHASQLPAGTQAAPSAPVPPILQRYKPLGSDQLKHPDDGDWLMVRRTYNGWGYSPLDQITPANVARLQPLWVIATGVVNGHEAAPILNNGVMFVATPGNQVIAIEAATGHLLWRYRRPLPEDAIVLHATSSGVALSAENVLLSSAEA